MTVVKLVFWSQISEDKRVLLFLPAGVRGTTLMLRRRCLERHAVRSLFGLDGSTTDGPCRDKRCSAGITGLAALAEMSISVQLWWTVGMILAEDYGHRETHRNWFSGAQRIWIRWTTLSSV